MSAVQQVHPLGKKAKLLLSSVFGPFARDDEYGSRRVNPMELYHNQVTRVQGPFSLRMFHRSFGLLLLQANVEAPCTVLDFPSLERFTQEIATRRYDVVGISAIAPNIGKVRKMCELVREHQPGAVVVVGGHIANKGGIESLVDADHVVKGDGVAWLRRYLGQDEKAPVRHPAVYSGFGTRIMGYTLPEEPGETAAVLVPSVGCPVGCNFCCTSALFGGKGRFVSFFETGDELFEVMCDLERKLGVRSFFTLDENFLLHRKRALRLLELMEEHGKSWALYVFSSARVLKSYTMDQLTRLGVSWVWMGLEGENSRYAKLNGVDTLALVRELQSHGVRVLGSSIVGLEDHAPENMDEVIDRAVSHGADFHQFMLYTPMPGTPLYERHEREGTLLPESSFPLADTHGQYRFNYRHPRIRDGMEEEFLLEAFRRDFQVNGPSIARLVATTLKGWKRHGAHPDERVRHRFAWEARSLPSTHAGAVWAMKRWYRKDARLHARLDRLLRDLYEEFGWKARMLAPLYGSFLLATLTLEDRRLARGWTYEPPCVYEKNPAAEALERPAESRREAAPAASPARTVQPAAR